MFQLWFTWSLRPHLENRDTENQKIFERRRSDSRSTTPFQIPVSSPWKSERKVPNILRKSPSKDVKTTKTNPTAKEQESKGKKSLDKEKERKVEKPSSKEQESEGKKSSDRKRKVTVGQKIPKETLSEVLKVQNPEMKKKKSAPTFEQLAVESEKILASIKMTQATKESFSSKEQSGSEGNSSKDSKEPANASKFGLTRSSFFVFNNKLPFGQFEEDI